MINSTDSKIMRYFIVKLGKTTTKTMKKNGKLIVLINNLQAVKLDIERNKKNHSAIKG